MQHFQQNSFINHHTNDTTRTTLHTPKILSAICLVFCKGILGLLEIILEEPALRKQQKTDLRLCYSSAKSMLLIVNDIIVSPEKEIK